MSRSLPARPSLEWLKKSAKDELKRLRAQNPAVLLAEAQLALAREYGFDSWRNSNGMSTSESKSSHRLRKCPR